MGIDTDFHNSVTFSTDDVGEAFDLSAEWAKFTQKILVIDGEEIPRCWDLVDDELVANSKFRMGVAPYVEYLAHVCKNFFKPNRIVWFDTVIPWFSSWGDCEAGVLYVGKMIKLVIVNQSGDVRIRKIDLTF